MKKVISVGSDFSGVGAFDHAMRRVSEAKGFQVRNIFACDMDKYARKSYLANHEAPEYYTENVYDRKIPKESLDVYISSFPCQSFSIAGKRQGKDDEKGRGILFFNSLEFIRQNKPRFFIFENVKGLLSDDSGKTFNQIISLSGGKSINGTSVFISDPDSVPYHVYYKVMNAKNHGIPQNRERIFIIGIRDDEDNDFTFPKEEHLKLRLKDILETEVDEKYFLSEKMVEKLTMTGKDNGVIANLNKGGERGEVFSDDSNHISCRKATDYKQPKQILISNSGKNRKWKEETLVPPLRSHNGCAFDNIIQINDPKHSNDRIYDEEGVSPTHSVESGGNRQPFVQVKSATSKGFEEATTEDSINFSNPQSETRRGRVGKGVAQTLDTSCNQGVIVCPVQLGKSENYASTSNLIGENNQEAYCIRTNNPNGVMVSNDVIQMNNSKESGGKQPYQQNRIYDTKGLSPALCKDKSDLCIPVLTPDRIEKRQNGRRFKEDGEPMFTLTAQDKHGISDGFRIRKLTPLECGRLMNFPDSHTENCHKAGISDSQLYKQAGNSIVVRCLELIISNFNL